MSVMFQNSKENQIDLLHERKLLYVSSTDLFLSVHKKCLHVILHDNAKISSSFYLKLKRSNSFRA